MEPYEPNKLSWRGLMPAGVTLTQFDVGISSSGPTPTVAQHAFGTTEAEFASSQTHKNLNVVFTFVTGGTSPTYSGTVTCIDTAGNTYAPVGSTCTIGSGSQTNCAILVCTSIAGTSGSNLVLPSLSGGTISDVMIIEFGGAIVGWTLDTGSQQFYVSTTSPSINITTANANELLVGAVGDTAVGTGSGIYTAPTLWNQIDNQTGAMGAPLLDAWQQGGAAGSATFAPTSNLSLSSSIGLVAVQIQ